MLQLDFGQVPAQRVVLGINPFGQVEELDGFLGIAGLARLLGQFAVKLNGALVIAQFMAPRRELSDRLGVVRLGFHEPVHKVSGLFKLAVILEGAREVEDTIRDARRLDGAVAKLQYRFGGFFAHVQIIGHDRLVTLKRGEELFPPLFGFKEHRQALEVLDQFRRTLSLFMEIGHAFEDAHILADHAVEFLKRGFFLGIVAGLAMEFGQRDQRAAQAFFFGLGLLQSDAALGEIDVSGIVIEQMREQLANGGEFPFLQTEIDQLEVLFIGTVVIAARLIDLGREIERSNVAG